MFCGTLISKAFQVPATLYYMYSIIHTVIPEFLTKQFLNLKVYTNIQCYKNNQFFIQDFWQTVIVDSKEFLSTIQLVKSVSA